MKEKDQDHTSQNDVEDVELKHVSGGLGISYDYSPVTCKHCGATNKDPYSTIKVFKHCPNCGTDQ